MNSEIETLVDETFKLDTKIKHHETYIETLKKQLSKINEEQKEIEEQIKNSETEISKYQQSIESNGKKINELINHEKMKNKKMNEFIKKYIKIIKNTHDQEELLNELETLYKKYQNIDIVDEILSKRKQYNKMSLPQLQKQLESPSSDIDQFCIHLYIKLELNDLDDSQLSRGGKYNKSKNSNKLRKSRLTKRRHRQD